MMPNRKKIAIITYHMVPHTLQWGASQRMHFLANQLVASGYDVTLFHASFGSNNTMSLDSNYNKVVSYIYPSFLQRIQSGMQLAFRLNSQKSSILKTSLFVFVRNIFIYFYRFFDKYFFNDFNRIGLFTYLWNFSVSKRIQKCHNSKKFNLVIISGPYFTNFRLISFIKKKLFVPVFLDYRDPWNLLRDGSFYTRYTEKKLCSKADLLIFFSDNFREDMISRFRLDPNKCLTMYNGYDNNAWSKLSILPLNLRAKVNNRFIISYVSSHISLDPSSGRDPSNLISAISCSSLASSFHLNLIGCDNIHSISQHLKSHNLSFNTYGKVDHLKSLEFLSESHLVVILSSDSKPSSYTLTGKLFDCIKSGAMILGISNEEIAYSDVISNNNLGFNCSNSSSDIQQKLKKSLTLLNELTNSDLVSSNRSSYFKPMINSHVYSRYFQNQKLIEKINLYLS